MQLGNNTKIQIVELILPIFLTILGLAGLMAGCSEKEPSETPPAPTQTDTFTFFNLGKNSILSDDIRDELESELGNDAIEHRNILDLETNYPGFLRRYFSDLDELNQKLNFPPGERVEHNTVKLMYRYAQKKNVPFDYVELIFSNFSKVPLLFKINFQKDELNTVETLITKNGQPQEIVWKEQKGKSFYWQKNSDFLIVSFVPNQFGQPEYQIRIYFTDNIRELINTERRENIRKRSGKSAF